MPEISNEKVSHVADSYVDCIELAKTNSTAAVLNQHSLQFFALDAYTRKVVPGGCVGTPPPAEASASPSAAAASSAVAAPAAAATSPAAAVADCHTHSDGTIHCDTGSAPAAAASAPAAAATGTDCHTHADGTVHCS